VYVGSGAGAGGAHAASKNASRVTAAIRFIVCLLVETKSTCRAERVAHANHRC
jgi:hypothetical protein